MGAGWYEHEYRAYGYEFGDAPERLRKLGEALQVLKAMWTQERATFEGRYYQVRGAINEPKPVQKPHPPLWIGGGGEKVTLKLVALHGDACNIIGDPETGRRKLEVLRGHCQAAGRDYDAILKTTNFQAILGDEGEQRRIVEDTARRTRQQPDEVRGSFNCGNAEQLAEALHRRAEAGFQYLIVYMPNAAEEGAVSRFAEEVIPLVAETRVGGRPTA
jgi:alkanesulfonate monooxygenase SsuD/methylene tetrahydromethanopterin reductase-like flavin-dependent oxidoreductase (luciferase family)